MIRDLPSLPALFAGNLAEQQMTRRTDTKTAELVEIALLTQAAFEQARGVRFAQIAGVPPAVIQRIFARPAGNYRILDIGTCGAAHSERRKVART